MDNQPNNCNSNQSHQTANSGGAVTTRGGRGGKSKISTLRSTNLNLMENEHHEKLTLNQDLYYNMLEIFEQRNKILLQKYPSHFVEDVLRRSQIQYTNYNFIKKVKKIYVGSSNPHPSNKDKYKKLQDKYKDNKTYDNSLKDKKELENKQYEDSVQAKKKMWPGVDDTGNAQHHEDDYVFYGYPTGNYIKQVCVILALWMNLGRFPIKLCEIESLKEHDESDHYIQSLQKMTPLICELFKDLSSLTDQKSPRALQKDICELLCLLEPRGFLLCLGVRRTKASEDTVLPPEREDLEDMFNRPNIEYSVEDLRHNPNPSILSVGARALNKHVTRKSSSGYWINKESLDGMSEREKNDRAQTIMNRIINTCQWINIFTLYSGSQEYILEIRDAQGFGARWVIQGQFRGLVEPQQKYK